MQEEQALDFYDRVVSGKDAYEVITLEHNSGAALEGVEMHPVDKRTLASVIERLPDELFASVDDVEASDPSELTEEELQEQGGNMSAVTEETVEAFEDLCNESLVHEELTSTHIEDIVSELSFSTLFEVGTEIIDMSVEATGAVRDFQKQT